MIASANEEYVKVIKDYSYSHQGQQHRIYRNDTYLVLEKRPDWWRVVCKRGKVIWAPESYLRPTHISVQEKKNALKAEYQGSLKAPSEGRGAISLVDKTATMPGAVAPRKDDNGNAPANVASLGPQEASRRHLELRNHLPTKEELSLSHQNHVEQQQLALSKEEPSLLSRKLSRKKEQKLSKKDISLPTLNSYNQPHIDVKDPRAVPKRPPKITKNDISRPIFCSYDFNASQSLPSPPVASTFKPLFDAMLNSDVNKNPLNASKPLLGTGSSNRSSRLSLYDGSCSSDSLGDILEENCSDSGLKNSPYNNAEQNAKHPINGRKASSDERLDSPSRAIDHRNVFSQLSHRNRSNSVDLKTSKDRVFSDPNDNVTKISKASENERSIRRRSLALEDCCQSNSRRTPLQDDFDSSHWLDCPPSLPPKKNRTRTDLKDSHLDEVTQSNSRNSPPLTTQSVSAMHNVVSRQGSHFLSSEQFPNPKKGHQSLQPRIPFEHKGSDESKKAYVCADCGNAACSGQYCQFLVQQRTPSEACIKSHSKYEDTSGSQVNNAVMTRSYTCIGSFSNSGHSLDMGARSSQRGEANLNPNVSALKRNDETKRSFKESQTGNVRKGSIRSLLQKVTSKNEPKRRESLNPHGLEGTGKKLPQCPPSPDASHVVNRKLDDNWVEYWYPEFKCLYYYNEVTKEKKWKPPRKHLRKQMPVEEMELQGGFGPSDGAGWSGASSTADAALGHPEYITQRSMTPSSRTSSAGSLLDNSLQLALQPQPPSIDSHSSSVASSSTAYFGLSGYAASTAPELEGSYGSSPDVSTSTNDSVRGGCYSNQGTGAAFLQSDKNDARQRDADVPTDHLDSQSSYDGPVLPPRPPNGAKPTQFSSLSDGLSASTEAVLHLSGSDESDAGVALREALQAYAPPEGWRKRTCSSRYIFINMANGEKWEATSTDDGKIYFFNTESGDSNWELPEASARHPSLGGGSGNTSDAEEAWPHSGPGTPTASPAGFRIVKQGMLMRTLYSREHKKVRKNWSSMCAMLVARPTDGPPSFGGPQVGSPSGPDASLRAPRYFFAFTKSPDDKKIRDEFEMLEPIRMVVGAAKNKSSRSNILSLTNAAGTELLLRHDELCVIDEWHGVLQGLELKLVPLSPPPSPKKQRNKSGDKDRGNLADTAPTSATTESFSTDQRTIRTKLLGFIKRRPTADALAKKGIIRDSVFGSTISELCMKEKTKSPLFVLQCINAIEKKDSNLKADGLYRISGNAAMIQKIRYEVEKNNYEVLFEEKDVNNLTGALKLFFRELKEPLLPYNTYDRFIEWSQKTRRGGKHAEELFEIVKLLPKENFETLKVLLRHLRRVCDYGADNRMNFMNIAIVFGPCLIWPETTTGRDLMTEVMVHNIVVEGLLSHFE